MARKSEMEETQGGGSIESFEKEFSRLNSLVDRLEAGNVPLGEMLKLYEEGMGLSAKLQAVLTGAELHVEKLGQIHEEQISRNLRGNGTAEYKSDSMIDSSVDSDELSGNELSDEEELLF